MAIVMATGALARADVMLDLLVRDLAGNPVDIIEAGDNILVFIRASVTEDDNPTQDVRVLQFDLRATDAQLELINFEWRFRAAGLFSEDLYERLTNLPDHLRATYTEAEREPGYIVDFDEDFRIIARVQVVAHRSGTIDVTSTDLSDPDNTDEGCWFVAGFDAPVAFTPHDGTVQGGELFIEVEGDDGFNGNANVNENVNDNEDDNLNDNEDGNVNVNENKNGNLNANENDNGDNFNGNITDGPRDEGPPVTGGFPCGIAMIGPMLFSLLGLLYQKRTLLAARRRRGS